MNNDIIDESALQNLLRAMGGDVEDLHELIDDFSIVGPELIDRLKQAAETHDWKSMRVSAHSLKSNAREFGATELEGLCKVLEAQCNENAVLHPENQITDIGEAFAKAQHSLQELKQHRA